MGKAPAIRVLHVDDEPDFAELTQTFLEREDDRFTADTATSASEGLDRLSEREYDCLISDYDMPGQNGIEFLEAVREGYPDLPFILFTGKGSEEVASEAISAGVTDYLQKGSGTDQFAVLANRVKNAVERRTAERERTRQLEAIETAREGISILDDDGHYIYVNQAFADLHGYDPEEMLGEHWELAYPDDDVPEVREDILPEVEQTGYWHGETTSLRADGRTVDVDHTLATTDRGELICTVRDVSEQKEREQELRQKTARLEALFEHSPVMINVHDADGNLIDPNPRLCEKTGYDASELAEMNVLDLDQAIESDEATALWEGMEVGDRRRFESVYRRRDGSTFPVEVHVRRLRFEGQDRFIAIAQDISDRKARQTEHTGGVGEPRPVGGTTADDKSTDGSHPAEDPRRTLEQLAEKTDDILFMLTGDWSELLFINSAFEDVWGWDVERLEDDPTSFLESVHPDDRETVRRSMETLSNGDSDEIEYRIVRPDGERRWIHGEGKPIFDDDGNVTRIAGFGRDITERKEQEQELERYRTFVDESTDLITLLDASGRIAFNSPAVEDVLGYEQGELVGEDSFEYIHPDDRERVRETNERALAAPDDVQVVEFRFRHADGSWVWFESRGRSRLDDTHIGGIVVSQRDITARVEREHALERLHEATRDLMTATTTEEVATLASETATQVLGKPMNGIHLYDAEADALVPVAWADRSETLLDGSPPALPVDDSLAGRAYQTGEEQSYADVREADETFNSDTPFRSERVLPLGDHGVFIISSPEPDAFDAADRALAHVLAANVEAALDRVEQRQQLQRERDRLDEFASIISHDLRNPLNVATGRLELVQMDCDSDHLDHVARAHERMDTLIDDILTLAQKGERVDETEAIELAEAVDGCWRNVETDGATLVTETKQTIHADQSRLKQLFENLFRNAVEHGGGSVTITVGDCADGRGFYVADDGPGIPESERESVFDAGYSTADESTGFGLNIVREIASAHGWDIRVTGGDDGGARFEITGVDVVETR